LAPLAVAPIAVANSITHAACLLRTSTVRSQFNSIGKVPIDIAALSRNRYYVVEILYSLWLSGAERLSFHFLPT